MKSIKEVAAQVKTGDVAGLKQRAKGLAAKAAEGTKSKFLTVVNKALHCEIDDRIQSARDDLISAQATWNELYAAIKHQLERAKKTGKTLRESSPSYADLASILMDRGARRSVQTAMAQDAAVAAKWEEYALNLENELLAPAKAECTAIFHEGDVVWSHFLVAVNELAARQSKEKLRGNTASQAELSSLSERKAQLEAATLPKLEALSQHAKNAMPFLVERHRHLHRALLRDAHTASTAAAGVGSSGGGEAEADAAAIVAATRSGWDELRAASGSASFGGGAAGGAAGGATSGAAPPQPPLHRVTSSNGVFGAHLETLAGRHDAVNGVPLCAHAMMLRLLTGRSPADAPDGGGLLIMSEGVFRLTADPDEVEFLKQALDGAVSSPSAAAAAMASVQSCSDPHVLATTLKQWVRKLPAPLIPVAAYRTMIALGQRGGAMGEELCELMRSLPTPNLRTLQALIELLEAVAAHQSSNRMSPSNLALVFAPTLCRSDNPSPSAEDLGFEMTVEIPAAATALTQLITRRAQCFPPSLGGTPLATHAAESQRLLHSPPTGGDMARATSDDSVGPLTPQTSAASVRSEADVTITSSPTPEIEPVAGQSDGGASGSSGGSAVSRSSSSLEPAAAEAAKVDMACWWYSASGQQQGPVTGAQLAAMLTRGEVTLKTWVFEGGRADWEQLSNAQPRLPQL